MSVKTANPDLILMRKSPCDRTEGGCGAAENEHCRTRNGGIAQFPHNARVRAYAAKRWGTEPSACEDSP